MSRIMEFKDTSPKSGLSHLDIVRDLEDKAISEDEYDDRNHKHHRREAHSRYPEEDSSHQVLIRPYRKRNQTFGNGYPSREGGFNSNDTWKSYDNFTHEDAFSGCFDKRRLYVPSFSRGVMDAHQSNRINPRLSQLDIAAQLVHQGSFPSNLFSRTVLPTVPNVLSTSWNVLDTLQSLGMQRSQRTPFLPSQGIGFPRQQCKDFEERGFCLRGDMCPMEHGVNRIVIDDVQCLSQFNLPSVPVPGTSENVSSSTFMNSKGLQKINRKHGINDVETDLDSGFVDNSVAESYDPDQPLWIDNRPKTSPGIVSINGQHFNENDPSDQRIVATTTTSQSSLLWGRIVGSRSSKLEVSNNDYTTFISSSNLENQVKKEETDLIELSKGVVNKDGEMDTDNDGSNSGLSSKPISDPGGCSYKRRYQKASRTLFVSGIPPKENKREALLLHFKKFGKVIDIYIPPSKSDRAFVQFLRKEEAESALKALDAVMGNRFINLRWANRDNILDDSAKGHGNVRMPVKKGSVSNVLVTVTKPINNNSLKSTSYSKKKLEDLEIMKKEIRKKQDLLEQKRNEFRRQLDKLTEQATGLKDEGGSNPLSKRHKSGGALVDVPRIEVSKFDTNSDSLSSPQPQKDNNSTRLEENNKPISNSVLHDSRSLKHSIRPSAPFAPPFFNKHELDNCPAVFTVLPPLPSGLSTVTALKEHFSSYGELDTLVVDNSDSETRKMSARIAYTSRQYAEKAFLNGKCWQGHELKFLWGSNGKISKDTEAKENPLLLVEKSLGVKISVGPENVESESLNRQEDDVSQCDEILKFDKEEKSL